MGMMSVSFPLLFKDVLDERVYEYLMNWTVGYERQG